MNPRFHFPKFPGDQPAPPTVRISALSAPPASGAACDLPPGEPPPKSTPAASADLVAAVRRLTAVCAEHLATAPRLGLQPSPAHLLRVIDAAIAEAEGRSLPDWGTDIEGYFLQSLCEDLGQQPANLYTGTRLLHGEEVPVPISTENWIECLCVFRAAILRGDVVVPAAKATARYLGERRPGHVFVPVPASADALRSPPAHLLTLKQWTRDILGLGEDDIITINELACRDPGCPVLETIVAVFAEGSTLRWKLPRPGCAITRTLLRQALATPPR
jgi:hypothetical protein